MLTNQQLLFFKNQGYVVIEDVFDQENIITPIRFEYENLLNTLITDWVEKGALKEPPEDADFFEKLDFCYREGCEWFQPLDISLPDDTITQNTAMHFGPAVFDLLTCPKLLDIIEQLIGSEITSNPIQHVRLKPPATKLRANEIRSHITHTDWHQDRGVALQEADNTNMVTVWCAISDATINNGCLQVIPHAPKIELLPHCPKAQMAIADGFFDETQAIPLPVKSGGIVLFHPLTPHSSLPNKTDTFRWSFDIRFNKSGEPIGRAHFPEFIARSQLKPESVLNDWKIWRQMWEQARLRLASQERLNAHRWTADAPACA